MIFVIFLVILFIAIFAIKFTALEGKRQNKHRQFKQAKGKNLSKDD